MAALFVFNGLPGGVAETLEDTLAAGNFSGPHDIEVASSQFVRGVDGATPGPLTVQGGARTTNGSGARLLLRGGISANGGGGEVTLEGRGAIGNGSGGGVAIRGGLGATGGGGSISVTAGNSGSSGNPSGNISINAGSNGLSGGTVNVNGGFSTSGGGDVIISGGPTLTVATVPGAFAGVGGAGLNNDADGGPARLTGGSADGTGDGGDAVISGGADGGGGGESGKVILESGGTSYPLTAAGAGPALVTTAQTIIEAINEVAAVGGVLEAEAVIDFSVSAVAAALIPAGALQMSVTSRVLTTVSGGGSTGYEVGDGTDADRWGVASALAVGTTTDAETAGDNTVSFNNSAAAVDVTLTGVGGVPTAGTVRVRVHYMLFAAPTS